MNKVRVYEVAKELGIENRELVARLAALGIQVRNHMSALDESEADRVRKALSKEKVEKTVEERIRPTVVRRRSVQKDSTSSDTVEAQVVAEVASVADSKTTSASTPTARTDNAVHLAASAQETASNDDVEDEVYSAIPGQPAPASVRLAHGTLPPGVVARGNTVAPSAAPLSRQTVTRIVSQYDIVRGPGASPSDQPRRRELGRAALAQPQRPQSSRMPKRKQVATKKGQKTEITVPSAQKRVIRIEDQIALQTLAQRMSLKATDVLMKLMQLGMTGVNINTTLDADTAKILANEFSYEVENVAKSDDEMVNEARGQYEDTVTDRISRPPVVTVMGHVDHGKTSLLDAIRSANVVSGEAGGITQHIGAYSVEIPQGTVVFLDTPGHEAFTSMRARGAQATDVVVLVVAADDGVMPQTREAIAHAKAANVPIIVALNKIDKPGARSEVIKGELAQEGLQPEEWGGETIFVEVSAKTKAGIDKLLSSILIQSEMLELNANPSIPAEGVVLEAYLDKGRGPVANVLVQNGTLNRGDTVVSGGAWGKIRALRDDKGRTINTAPPSTPVEILGLTDMPAAGDRFFVVTDAKKAQDIASVRKPASARPTSQAVAARGLEQLYQSLASGESHELRLVIKADVQGSVEAITKALTDLSTDKVKVMVIHQGVGGITENDIMLAKASNAFVLGFGVRPAGNASQAAKSEGVDVRLYSIIYEAIDEVKKAMTGLLKPKLVEKALGQAEVRQVFHISKVGTVAGCYVTEGKIKRGAKVRLIRDSVQIWEGSISALKRFKDDAREVQNGFECGLSLAGYNDVHEKDVIECFEVEEVAATLE